MGRKRKNNGRKSKQGRKRQRVGRYWVEDYVGLQPPDGESATMAVTITRVELDDNHTHRPSSGKKIEPKKITEKDTAGDSDAPDDDDCTNIASDHESKSIAHRHNSRCEPLDDEAINNAYIAIQRDPSAQGEPEKFPHQNFQPLAHGNCGDGTPNPHDKSEVPDKYWAQRKRFFSRFDEGIVLDKEGWYSVTPEAIAQHLASRIVGKGANNNSLVVLDAFCGVGGNAIAFAQRPEVSIVVAVDSDKKRLELAAKNAAVYNISKEKLIFIHGNACEVLQAYKESKLVVSSDSKENSKEANTDDTVHHGYTIGDLTSLPGTIDSIFLSPPWGGMDYEKTGKRNYHVETCMEVEAVLPGVSWDGKKILQASAAATKGPVVFFLPRNVNGLSLGQSALSSGFTTMEMEQNVLNNKLKTVTAYFGM